MNYLCIIINRKWERVYVQNSQNVKHRFLNFTEWYKSINGLKLYSLAMFKNVNVVDMLVYVVFCKIWRFDSVCLDISLNRKCMIDSQCYVLSFLKEKQHTYLNTGYLCFTIQT